jgi:hypothetical protein
MKVTVKFLLKSIYVNFILQMFSNIELKIAPWNNLKVILECSSPLCSASDRTPPLSRTSFDDIAAVLAHLEEDRT